MSKKKHKHAHHFNRSIRILLATNAIVLVAGAMLGPIYALFVADIGGDLLDAGAAASIFAIAAGSTALFSGKIADSIKETEIMVIAGYLILAIGFIGFTLVQDMWSLLLVQAIIGFGEAIYSPAYDALYSDHSDKSEEGLEWGAWEAMNYFTYAGGALIGGVVATYLGFNILFTAMAVLCMVSAVYLLVLPREVL